MMSTEFSAVLLTGGKSTRMGYDKASVVVKGRPLWRRQLDTLQATNPGEVFISGRADGPYAGAGVPIILDENVGLGPLGGITAALRHARFDYLLVLAVDLPAMTSDFLRTLVRLALRSQCGVVPADEPWFEGMAAVYPRSCLPLADEHLRSPDRSMQRFIREALVHDWLVTHAVGPAERSFFRNVNTPADLDAGG